MLVVRELLLGPQRFSDLRHALRGASSNLVVDRLRELESRGVIRRRKLASPAASWVYELTEWGQELEPILLALGDWGVQVPLPAAPTLSATSVLLFLRRCAEPAADAPPTTYRLELDDRVWTVRTALGRVEVVQGDPIDADASLRADPAALNALVGGTADLDAALSDDSVDAAGDIAAVRRLLRSVRGTPATV